MICWSRCRVRTAQHRQAGSSVQVHGRAVVYALLARGDVPLVARSKRIRPVRSGSAALCQWAAMALGGWMHCARICWECIHHPQRPPRPHDAAELGEISLKAGPVASRRIASDSNCLPAHDALTFRLLQTSERLQRREEAQAPAAGSERLASGVFPAQCSLRPATC